MKTVLGRETRKRAVNLTLSEDLVVEVCGLTNNLFRVVESLLVDYVEHERRQRLVKENTAEATVSRWNTFDARHGFFADEYSSL